jgi:hypothetical protein
MIEKPTPQERRERPTEEQIERAAAAAARWIVEDYIMRGEEETLLLDTFGLYGESRRKFERRTMEIVMEEAQKIASDESKTPEVRERAEKVRRQAEEFLRNK